MARVPLWTIVTAMSRMPRQMAAPEAALAIRRNCGSSAPKAESSAVCSEKMDIMATAKLRKRTAANSGASRPRLRIRLTAAMMIL